ncbi:MAG: diaminopimelate decarboxylase [Fusobacteriaceae bacterium]
MLGFGSMKNNDGILEIGGVKTTELVAQYGTPLYVMDYLLIEENILKYKLFFQSKHFKTNIIYASKAFLCKAMCQIIEKYDISIDAVSGGELYTIKSSGIDMQRVHMHGNNKSIDELEMCLENNINSIILDNEEEIKKLSKICQIKNKKMKVMLRMNIGIDAHTHEYIKTAKHSSKFGVSIFENKIFEILKMILEDENLEFLGFHCHIGSQIFEINAFYEAIEIMVKFTKSVSEKLNIVIPEINLGGGFGVFYTESDVLLDIEYFMKSLIKCLEENLEREQLKIEKISIEPGRSIVANAGTTLYKVGARKKTFDDTNYIFVDGGMTDNIRPALYKAEYTALAANKMNDIKNELVSIAGKCCESSDIIAKDINFQTTVVGDIVAICTTGAYGYSMASNYNKLRVPAVVFVKNGKSYLGIKRETFEDLVKNDLFIDI